MGTSSGPWGQSRMGIIPDNLIGSSTNTCVETDFDGAVKTCEANNARLCTPQEMSDCALVELGATSTVALCGRALLEETDAVLTPSAAVEHVGLTGPVQQSSSQLHLNESCSWEGKDCNT